MKFKGDIIITDPCYIIKKNTIPYPNLKDYVEGVDGNTPFTEYTEEQKEQYKVYQQLMDNYWEESRKNDDWSKCDYGDNMGVLGINTFLTRGTIYGDWSCTTYEKGTNKELGKFCADAGLVSVFLLEEVLKYNPDFDYHINNPWTTTLIKDFDGDIEIDVVNYEYEDRHGNNKEDEEVRVIGKGNINFWTSQTGF